jgi:hypothetical protein
MFSARSLTVLALLVAVAGRDPVTQAYDPALEEGFRPLCNGVDLTGWHGGTGNYAIEDGAIVCRPREEGGNLYTDAEFSDFELRFDFRLDPGANNGIGLRVPDGGHASSEGMEIQILDDDDDQYASLAPYQYHGSVYGIVPAERGHLKPDGEWNSQTIRCVGRHVTVILNDVTIVEADLDAALANGAIDGREHPGAARTSGHLCLCGHGTVVAFRNLRVREIAGATESLPD